MGNVVKLKRKVRPLQATYSPTSPYAVERLDEDDGTIVYEVVDARPESYRPVCTISDIGGTYPYAKHDAEQIARGLNLLVQYGMGKMPDVRDPDDEEV